MGKHTHPPCTGLDIAACLRAFPTDLGLQAEQILDCHQEDTVLITTRVWRDVEGVKIGICRESVLWTASDIPLLSKQLASLHRMYHKADYMATIPYGSKRNPNKG